jgi:segregation and condensation protein B
MAEVTANPPAERFKKSRLGINLFFFIIQPPTQTGMAIVFCQGVGETAENQQGRTRTDSVTESLLKVDNFSSQTAKERDSWTIPALYDIFWIMSDNPDEIHESETTVDQAGTDQAESAPADHQINTEQVIEAVLFASDSPLAASKMVSLLGVGTAREVKDYIESLNRRYEKEGASFRIEQIAGGYQMLTLPAYNTWIRRLKQNRQDSKLSPASLETLALVAYKQPVVRADIEAVRGVSCGELLNRLRELGLIKIVGRAEDVGRPMLYGTTKRFLEVFALSSLDDLPEVEELQAPE